MIGIELEWADVDRHMEIPAHLGKWNTADYSIVNSNGVANHPTGAYRWGGEINTIPTNTSAEQAQIVHSLAQVLRGPPGQITINYKCNTHVHISPSVYLLEDLDLLKQVASYLRNAEDFVYTVVEPITAPTRMEYPDPEELRGAIKRRRRNLKSHQHRISDIRWNEMIRAQTIADFKDAHASPTSAGGRAWHIASRPGMNLRSLWKHGTIEYRHFPGTADPEEIESCAEWCMQLTEAAVHHRDVSPRQIYESRNWKFPKFARYDHRLQLGFDATRFK